jgi:predicted cupin superfamily sugar epimerase
MAERNTKMTDAKQWIDTLHMTRHAEGGFFKQSYRCIETIDKEHLPARFDGNRQISSAIYFLLEGDDFSAFHRLRQDELWHFYQGCPLTIHVIDEAGEYSEVKLGVNLSKGELPQAVVRAGRLFGATIADSGSYALVGCTTAPGFEYDDFEMPSRERLLDDYPRHRKIIERLTRSRSVLNPTGY